VATGEPFVFDAASFYAHNEYEIGNWRAARHRLSAAAYVESYLREYRASEPGKPLSVSQCCFLGLKADYVGAEEEWDDRNLLYSLRFDLGTAILIPCNQRQM
jgi:hypothetical protein